MSSSSSQFLGADSSTSSLPRPARCFACGSRGNPNKTTRNLVVCIDGTANKFGRKNTNVVKLFEAVDCDTKDPWPEQYTYYSSGIGTRPRILHVFQRVQRAISDKLDMAIAWNMEEIVKEAYAWLAGKYQEGDQIYLFGFSRGAYQVRILAGMIYEVGLIKNPTEKQIGTAYDHFESILSHKPNANDMAREFKVTFSWKDVRAHFIGVWDTVSSVGFGRGDVCLSASSAAAHACHIRHALALDERRVKFIPEYFLEMNSPDLHKSAKDTQLEYPNTKSRMQSSSGVERSDRKTADIKEVWFAGYHSDVGGTNRPGETYHAGNVSLMWMRREASMSGLVLKSGDVLWTLWTDEDIDLGITDSMTLFWKLFEFLPIKHEVSFNGSGENARRLHLFEPRRIIPGQKIHASVQFANTYIPNATFGNGFGNPLETAGPMPSEDDIWEKGAIDHMTYVALFNYLTGKQEAASFYLHKLLFLLRFTEGRSPINGVPEWQRALADLIHKQSDLVRLVAMAAYFEAVDSCTNCNCTADIGRTLPDEVFVEARQSLAGFMKPDQPDWPRAVALLRPLAKHKDLRDLVLTTGVVDGFLQLLDHIIVVQGEHFAHVMDALSSLVEFRMVGQYVRER
ncbi:hypothetical protein EV363DRAFT_1177514 [Boletus edulis]|nr:hypothetical protein EV363DRAFT_1177514 [Boletus edulis]